MVKNKCRQNPTKWHNWFAWYPVTFDYYTAESGRICWKRAFWVTIQRKCRITTWDVEWFYREIPSDLDTRV